MVATTTLQLKREAAATALIFRSGGTPCHIKDHDWYGFFDYDDARSAYYEVHKRF